LLFFLLWLLQREARERESERGGNETKSLQREKERKRLLSVSPSLSSLGLSPLVQTQA
jgi:hypothetical protein